MYTQSRCPGSQRGHFELPGLWPASLWSFVPTLINTEPQAPFTKFKTVKENPRVAHDG